MSNKKQTAVDIFHNKVNELIGSKIIITNNDLGKIWNECKNIEHSIFFHWYFKGKNNTKENKSFRQHYNETYGPNLEENKTNNMKLYRHKTTKAIMSGYDYNHLSFAEQQQMELTDRVTVAELDQMSRNKSYWVSKPNDGGEKTMASENNNPGTTTTDNTPITGQNNTGTYPEPHQTWLHYKGGRYEIIAMCNHTTTNEVMVIYKSLSFNGFHARPYSEWHDEVWDGPHCKTRFTLVSW
jgi:hypothetical protein